jgi:hypothetical protein
MASFRNVYDDFTEKLKDWQVQNKSGSYLQGVP